MSPSSDPHRSASSVSRRHDRRAAAPPPPRPEDPLLTEARRALTLCNVCAYCTGYCETFRSARRCPSLHDVDLYYLAVLCHNCRSCWYACQYAPPHVFAINIPALMARVRQRAYRVYAFPPGACGTRDGQGGVMAVLIALLCVVGVPLMTWISVPPEILYETHQGPGAFYRIIPLDKMTALGVTALAFGTLPLLASALRFWRAIGGRVRGPRLKALPVAVVEAFTLPSLKGGGPGCPDHDATASGSRRRLHQILVAGVGLCLLSTASASAFHHLFGWVAPYHWFSLPVVSGTAGGVLILVGALGLLWRKKGADPRPTALETLRDDTAFLGLLIAVAGSGLALLLARETGAMGLLLAFHLGSVVGLFLTLALGKFRHAPFRLAALLRSVLERRHER
ncbi:tricarballylate utilization 4Fe-4S protein TcuB [Pararhodospirillum photometricum]|nr:tricarballylate utilization 4Fe-4S protein TcuB [Pararhodospirillum photometricum]